VKPTRALTAVLLLAGCMAAQTVSGHAAPTNPATPSAQQALPAAAAQPSTPDANPADVKSIEAIIHAVYDVISGPPGERDWKRFRSLFIPEARLIFSGKNARGEYRRTVMTPEDYIQRSGPMFLKEGFFEKTIGNRVEQFGTVAHVFSAYETLHGDKKPMARGINSIQLVNDGKRWYVVTILWDQERPDNPIPEKYLQDGLKATK